MTTYYRSQRPVSNLPETVFGLNEYFTKRLDESSLLVTTRHGGWLVMSDQERRALETGRLEKDASSAQLLKETGLLLTPSSLRAVLADLRSRYRFLSNPASFHVISLTDQCDLQCLYCHPAAGPGRTEMSEETVEKVLTFVFSKPARFLNLQVTGGEPLLRWPLVKKIYLRAKELARDRGVEFRFLLSTNLTLVTEEMAKELAQMDVNISSSLDGPKELHDQQRPYVGDGHGSYEKTTYWLKRLKEEFNLKIGLLPVVTALSLKVGPKAIIDEYVRLGQTSVSLKPFRSSGRAWQNLEKLAITPENFFSFWSEGVEYCLELNKKGISVKEANASFLLRNILFSTDPGSMCFRRPCGAGLTMLAYKHDGTIVACDAARDTNFLDLGNVETDSYETIRAKTLPLAAVCPDVIPFCSACPFMAYCNTCRIDTWSREADLFPKAPRSFDCQWHQRALIFLFQKLLNKEAAQFLQSWAKS